MIAKKMKLINRIIMAVAMLCVSIQVMAQEGYSGYFLDNYTYRFEMNPAAGSKLGYLSLPGAGNIGVSVNSTVNLRDFVYIKNGTPVLFTNPQVTASEFIDNLPARTNVGASTGMKLLSFGFKAFGGYANISLGTRVNANFSVPKELFGFLKNGLSNEEVNIRDVRLKGDAYASAALNYSHNIPLIPGLRVGATVKYLAAIASIDARLNSADIALGVDDWQIRSNADVYLSGNGFEYTTSEYQPSEGAPRRYVSGVDHNGELPYPDGSGFAADLGAEWKWRGVTLSAAVLDMGYITWNKTRLASTDGTRVFSTNNYDFPTTGEGDGETERLKDDLARLYQLDDKGIMAGRHQENLPVTVNVGVDIAMPFWDKLHLSALNTRQWGGIYDINEYRFGVNLAPASVLSIAANYTVGTYGQGVGWMLSLKARGFNLFMGMDRMPLHYTPQWIPMTSAASVNFGVNFPF